MGKGLLIGLALLLAACAPAAKEQGTLPLHPKAEKATCPVDVTDAKCYFIPGVTVDESIEWFREKLSAQGWVPPAVPPDDEPFPYYFTQDGRKVLLVFSRRPDGSWVMVNANPDK